MWTSWPSLNKGQLHDPESPAPISIASPVPFVANLISHGSTSHSAILKGVKLRLCKFHREQEERHGSTVNITKSRSDHWRGTAFTHCHHPMQPEGLSWSSPRSRVTKFKRSSKGKSEKLTPKIFHIVFTYISNLLGFQWISNMSNCWIIVLLVRKIESCCVAATWPWSAASPSHWGRRSWKVPQKSSSDGREENVAIKSAWCIGTNESCDALIPRQTLFKDPGLIHEAHLTRALAFQDSAHVSEVWYHMPVNLCPKYAKDCEVHTQDSVQVLWLLTTHCKDSSWMRICWT